LELRIPEGVKYQCTGCGQCCLGWPVPITEDDYQRLSSLRFEEPQGALPAQTCITKKDSQDPALGAFTRTLGKRSDGRCEFLSEDNRCQIHVEHGPELKPAMCQLFPYTFTETPSGVYASVSFVSSGALLNAGQPLSEQEELLSQKLDLYRSLFPDGSRDWSGIQLAAGFPLTWEEYMRLDAEFLHLLKMDDPARADKKLLACSRYLVGQLPRGTNLERFPSVTARPKVVDQVLIQRCYELYLSDDPYACSTVDLYTQAVLADLMSPPEGGQLCLSDSKCGFNQLLSLRLGDLDRDVEDLLSRFAYSKVFGKLYFGAGFAGLSVLAGVHHLLLLVALVRLKVKVLLVAENRSKPDVFEIAEIVRTLDRRLAHVSFSKDSSEVFELLLTSPERLQRIVSLGA